MVGCWVFGFSLMFCFLVILRVDSDILCEWLVLMRVSYMFVKVMYVCLIEYFFVLFFLLLFIVVGVYFWLVCFVVVIGLSGGSVVDVIYLLSRLEIDMVRI